MKPIILFALVVFACFQQYLYAQTSEIDSLYHVFTTKSKDSVQFDQLEEIILKAAKVDYLLVKKYANVGINLATAQKDSSSVLIFKTHYSKFLKKDSSAAQALAYLEKAYLQLKASDSKGKNFAINNLAALYTESNQIKKGAEAYKESMRLSKLYNKDAGVVSSTIGLVTLFVSQKMYSEAKPYMDESVIGCNLLELPTRNHCLGVAYNNLAAYYLKTDQLDSAILYCNKSIKVKEAVNNILGIISSLQTKGNCQLKLNDTLASVTSTLEAIKLARTSPKLKTILVGSLLHLVNIYTKIDQTKKADILWQEIEENKSFIKRMPDQLNYYVFKVGFLISNNKIKEAMNLQKEQFNFLDSLRNVSNASIVSEMENQFETEKYKQEKLIANIEKINAQKQTAMSKKNNLYIVGFTIFILILLLFLISRFSVIKKQKKKLNQAYSLLETSKNNELAVSNLKALQSQMNPHFIFNALNSVQDLVLLQDIRNSNKYLGKFSDLIRKILLSSKKQFINLEEEIEMLTLYLDLEKLRFGENFKINFKIELAEKDIQSIKLPAMFIQPYIENAIKHGLFHKEGEKQLAVQFFKKNNFLNCIVQDNGVGQKKSNELKKKNRHLHTGFSTEAINDRISLLNKTLQNKILIETIDLIENGEAKGTRVHLQFPI